MRLLSLQCGASQSRAFPDNPLPAERAYPMPRIYILATFLAVSLCACKEPTSPGKAAPAEMPFALPGVSLSVTQSSETCQPTGAYRATVAWEVPANLASRLEVQVDATERKHFVRSTQRTGQHQTGEWVSKGLAFFLIDRDTDMLLAATTARAGDCGMPAAIIR